MSEITLTLSRSIKEKKWIQVTYKNQSEEITRFWIAIKDILPNQKLIVDSIRLGSQDQPPIELTMYVQGIQDATLLDSTYYPFGDSLIQRIEKNPLHFEWLHYFLTDHKVLEYYKECYHEDVDLEEKNFTLLKGFDEFQVEDSTYALKNADQLATIYAIIKRQSFDSEEDRPIIQRLSFNLVSLRFGQSIKPIFYKDIRLDISHRSLVLGNRIRINPTFVSEKSTFNLKHYINMDIEPFLRIYESNPNEALDILTASTRGQEKVDTSPYIAVFKKKTFVSIEKEYNQITEQFLTGTLSRPLSAFFGKLGKINRRFKRDYPIFLTQKVNFDQLRGVFNAINQDITYVQGPPGTGKTYMIREAAISSLFNDRTMLIVSNNNEAIDNVDRLLNSYQYQRKPIPFLSLRIGNIDKTQEMLDTIQRTFKSFLVSKDKPKDTILKHIKDDIIKNLNITNDLVEIFEEKVLLEQRLEDLQSIQNLSEKRLLPQQIQLDIKSTEQRLKELKNITEDQLIKGIQIDERLLTQYLYFSSLKRINQLTKEEFKDLWEILFSKGDDRVEKFNTYIKDNNNLAKLLKVFPIIITTNISASRLGDASSHFDLMIMDEAGQCQVANSLIPMARADRALFVGDHRQLQPVTVIDPVKNDELKKAFDIADIYDYRENSILKVLRWVDNKSLHILLRRHYRSHHKIIDFSNQKYYHGRLIIENKEKLDHVINLIPLDNKEDNRWNTAEREIQHILREIKKKEYKPNTVGVITPFRNQANRIQEILASHGLSEVKVGTVHTFQGGEKDHILFSASLTKNTNPKAGLWAVTSEELVNVAVTRAKKKFTMICDPSVIQSYTPDGTSDLYDLYRYINNNGTVKVNENKDILENFIRDDDSYSEKEFYETIAQYVSTQQQLEIGTKELIKDVIKEIKPDKSYYRFACQAHFDFILYVNGKRFMAFEINGNEHESVDSRKLKDTLKKQICQDYGLKLFTLPNHQTRRYDLVVEMIQSNKN
jgi:hypothetical protein